MTTLPVIFSNKLYVPSDAINVDKGLKAFTYSIYKKESECRNCEYLDSRPNDCTNCANYTGTFKLAKEGQRNGEDYVAFPIGAKDKVLHLFPHLLDLPRQKKHPKDKLTFLDDLEYNWTLYDYQKEAIAKMIKAGYGVLASPPRSGKTVMGVHICLELGYKTLILARQQDWLIEFERTFRESTNIPDIEKAQGRRIVGLVKKDSDFDNLEICLITYQSLMHEGKGAGLLAKIKNKFNTLIVDETHQVAAKAFARVVSGVNAKHKFGLTGTPDRKDGIYFCVNNVIGPVRHTVKIQSCIPRVEFTESSFNKSFKTWNGYIAAIAVNKKRNQLIVDLVKKYLAEGHYIVIPVYRKEQVAELVDLINKQIDRDYDEPIAAAFTGSLTKAKREQLIKDARTGKHIKVVVGIRSIVQTGINIPIWSCLLEVAPIANRPQHIQECSRILTPLENKPQPVVHYIVDDVGIAKGCLTTCVKQTHVPLGHIITKENWKKLSEWLDVKPSMYEDMDPEEASTKPVKNLARESKLNSLFKRGKRI